MKTRCFSSLFRFNGGIFRLANRVIFCVSGGRGTNLEPTEMTQKRLEKHIMSVSSLFVQMGRKKRWFMKNIRGKIDDFEILKRFWISGGLESETRASKPGVFRETQHADQKH